MRNPLLYCISILSLWLAGLLSADASKHDQKTNHRRLGSHLATLKSASYSPSKSIKGDRDRQLVLQDDVAPERKRAPAISKNYWKLPRRSALGNEIIFPAPSSSAFSNPPSDSPSSIPSDYPSNEPSETPSSSPTSPPSSVMPIRIACLGDSLTRGVSGNWGNPGSDYPSQLQELLGPPFQTHNYGRNAVTAMGGISSSYNSTRTFQASVDLQADIYLIMLGTNDARYWVKDSHLFKPGMEWIIQKAAHSPSSRIILAIPPWVKKTNFGIPDEILLNNVRPIILQFAPALQVVDMYAVTVNRNDFYSDDNLHLNPKGYEALAKAWKSAILCNYNGICEVGESCETCHSDCRCT